MEKRLICFRDGSSHDHDQLETSLRMFLPPSSAQACNIELLHNPGGSELQAGGCSWKHDQHLSPQLLNMFPRHREEEEFPAAATGFIPGPGASSQGVEAAAASLTYHQQAEQLHEHLFYKVVTPSDVGKLNRLVIPKQHAERCFPLDPSMRKKGRFLAFQETQTGKVWWFRYSYWNSSQSYVFTKGWIRFVKENKLKAGDIVSFERGASPESFYISCRKRPRPPAEAVCSSPSHEFESQSGGPSICHDHHQHDLLLLHMLSSGDPEQLHEELEAEEGEEQEEDDDNVTGNSTSMSIKFHSTRLFGVEIAEPAFNNY